MCDHPNIKMVTSVIDYVFRVLALEYLGTTDYCQVKPTAEAEAMEKVLSVTETAREAEAFEDQPSKPTARIEEVIPQNTVSAAAYAAQPAGASGMKSQMESLMGDAPFCDVCGHITRAQRHLLQVPQLRQLDGLLVTEGVRDC